MYKLAKCLQGASHSGLSLGAACVLLLSPVLLGCATTGARAAKRRPAEVPRVGLPMPANASTIAIVHNGRTRCAHWNEVAGVEYHFDVTCGSSLVLSVETTDEDFRSPEGLKVGDTLARAAQQSGNPITSLEGSCGVELAQGWVAYPEPGLQPRWGNCRELGGAPIRSFKSSGEPDPARACFELPTNLAIRECLAGELEAARREYEQAKQEAWRRLVPAEREAFTAMEADGLRYEESFCQLSGAMFQGGTLEPQTYLVCRVELTRQRSDNVRALDVHGRVEQP